METIILNTRKKSRILAVALLFLTIGANAQSSNNFFNTLFDNLTKDNQASFYIIGGVAGFALFAFIISKIMSKYNKDEEKSSKNNVRPISHRHHRVIKKSA